jgi:hypothetical protein
VFRLAGGSHIELPCNEVADEDTGRISTLFSQVARQWWDSVVAEQDSFTKPVYYIGQPGALASNIEASGAIAIARGDINMTANVVFKGMGYACYSVNVSPGSTGCCATCTHTLAHARCAASLCWLSTALMLLCAALTLKDKAATLYSACSCGQQPFLCR